MIELSVILPSYNERENIPLLIERLASALSGISFEVIVVDDNSPDGTWQVASELALTRPWLRVIRRLHAKGLSSAVMAGFEASLGKYLAVMDADLQHDEAALPLFIDAFKNGAHLVVGSRKVAGGGVRDWSVLRRFVSFCASAMARLVLPGTVSDPMSGFFALRREVYLELAKSINPRGFKILLEFVARAKEKKIVEVGYLFKGRVHGESKLSTNVMVDYISALYDLSFGKWISRRFLKYIAVGLSGVAVNQIGLFVSRNLLSTSDAVALAIGIETSIITNFFLNNYWTFHSARLHGTLKILRGLVSFNTICLGGAFINYAVALFVQGRFGFSIYAANLLGILFATLWNYIVNSEVTWTRTKHID